MLKELHTFVTSVHNIVKEAELEKEKHVAKKKASGIINNAL